VQLPFRDFASFRGYWGEQGMGGGGGWAARRGYLNGLFNPIFTRLDKLDDERKTHTGVRGVDGQLKNIIFASSRFKPVIVLKDAINNVIEVTRDAEFCLVYDCLLQAAGLTWGELVDWWRATAGLRDETDLDVAHALYERLLASMNDNEAERLVFRTYCERYGDEPTALPALLPQVYLHYDPLTLRQRGCRPSVLMRERMDPLSSALAGKRPGGDRSRRKTALRRGYRGLSAPLR
jgi:hypothetical protein